MSHKTLDQLWVLILLTWCLPDKKKKKNSTKNSLCPFLPRWQLICELKNFWYQRESYFPYYVNFNGGKVTFFVIACSTFTRSTLASGMTMTWCAGLFIVSSQPVSDLSSSSDPVRNRELWPITSPSDTTPFAASPPLAANKVLWPPLSSASDLMWGEITKSSKFGYTSLMISWLTPFKQQPNVGSKLGYLFS